MKKTWKLTPELREALVADYMAGMSRGEVCKKYGLKCRKSVTTLLRHRGLDTRKGVHPRKYTLNEAAFDAVTEASSYWAGFLMADAGASQDGDRPEGFRVALAECDKAHLEALRAFLGTDTPLRWKPARNTREGWNEAPQWILNVYSKRLATTLAGFGIVPAKSATAKVAGLENDRHFWRGVIDGDGSLFWSRERPGHQASPVLALCGSRDLLEQFRAFAISCLPGWRPTVRPAKGMWATSASGSPAVDMAEVLYDGCTIALARKLEKATSFATYEPRRRRSR